MNWQRLKKTIKNLFFMLTHSPNSPAGLRFRAQRLIDQGVDPHHPAVTMLLKRADILEETE